MNNFDYGEVKLNTESIKLLKEIKQLISAEYSRYPFKFIYTGRSKDNRKKGLRPDFLSYCSPELRAKLQELSTYLANQTKLENPKLSAYGDLHSFFPVTWHRDSACYNYTNTEDKFFFNEKSRCLKFYVRMNFSFLDLMCKDQAGKVHRLCSNNNKLAFFDVRNLHKTYIHIFSGLKVKNHIYPIFDFIHNLLIKIYSKIQGIENVNLSNFYFMIYEDSSTLTDYIKIEKKRAHNQMNGLIDKLSDHYKTKGRNSNSK